MIQETYHTRYHESEGRPHDGKGALSMLISSSEFQFALFEGTFSRLMELGHVTIPDGQAAEQPDAEKLQFLLDNYRLPGARPSRAVISVISRDFSLVPSVYAGDLKAADALRFSGGAANRTSTTTISSLGIDCALGVDDEVIQVLERNFSVATVRHACVPAIQLLFMHHALRICNVHLAVHHGCIEVTGRKGQQLLFYNIFPVSGNEDILYYLLFITNEYGLKGKHITLGLSGVVEAGSELRRQLAQYTREVVLAVNDPSVFMSSKMSSLPAHYYFTVLNQHLCES